jgi:hypothetical protein
MASLLADGLNLGLTRMAEACSIASLGQLAWTADWHIRDETYALALRRLIDQQQREPLAAMFGSGFASSSDGQFFRAGGSGRDASSINAHYGVGTRKCSECTTSWTKHERAARWYVRSTLGLSRTFMVSRW